jgi:hypothetical protein
MVSKVGVAGWACEMPFCSKLIIKLMNHYGIFISVARILNRGSVTAPKGRSLSLLIMQIIYLARSLSDF